MKYFSDNNIHSSASDTVLMKLTGTILTQGDTVRFSDPGNLERFSSPDDRLLMDHFLTLSFSSKSSRKLLVFWDTRFKVWETFLFVSFC